MDVSAFSKELILILRQNKDNNKLHLMRLRRNISQTDLAFLSCVSLRTIQDYEQNRRDIRKASSLILYNLAKSLNCNIEDII